MSAPKEGDLRVYFEPEIHRASSAPFQLAVASPDEAVIALKAVALFDLYLIKNELRGDISGSCGGLEIYEGGEWVDWESDEGDDIRAYEERVSP